MIATGWGRSVLLLVVVQAGCGGNVTVSRGFASREVLPVRDSTMRLNYVLDVVGQDPVLVYTTQGDDAAGSTYGTLDLMTGASQDVGSQPPIDAGQTSGGRYTCQFSGAADNTTTVQITDSTTGDTTDVEGVTGFAGCPGDDGVISIFRYDPDDNHHLVLWTGPYQQLAMIQLPIEIHQLVIFTTGPAPGTDGGAEVVTGAILVASVPGDETALGIYSLDFGSLALASIVPATPASTAWAAGAQPGGSLESGSVALGLAVSPFNGHYVYGRTMSDGGTTLFAGPFDGGAASELALFQVTGAGTPALSQGVRVSPPDDSSTSVRLPAMVSWQVDDPTGATPSQMIVWDDTDGRVTVCPSTPNVLQGGVLSPDGTHILFSALSSSSIRTFGPLQIATMGPDGPQDCSQLVGDEVFWADYSGDGSMIAWISKTEVGDDTNLWLANADGSGQQMVASQTLYGARFMDGTNKLELAFGADLVWLDVDDPSHQLHYVAEQLFGASTSVASSWFVSGYDYNVQDSSGTLGTINLESGKKIQISPGVTQYVVEPQVARSDGAGLVSRSSPTGLYHVAYVVRGRNPSSQDGIWVATVQAADLQ